MINLLPGIQSTASALTAERIRTDAISQNIANAQTTRGADGKIYQRQKVVFETLMDAATGDLESGHLPSSLVKVRVDTDDKPPRLIPDPSNPGKMMEVPDINTHQEMVDLIVSQRAYEANLAVAKTSRAMAMQALSIGRR